MKFWKLNLLILILFCPGEFAHAQFFGSPDGDGDTSLFFTSTEDSFIGQGETIFATLEMDYLVQGFLANSSNNITVGFSKPGRDYRLSFNPSGNVEPGTYSLSRFGENADVAFSFTGNGRGANVTSGTVVLHELVFDDSEGRLDRLSLDFTQFEEGLFERRIDGQVRFDASAITSVPEPSTFALMALSICVAVTFRRR